MAALVLPKQATAPGADPRGRSNLRRRNSVETLKASRWWNPLRVRDELPELIDRGGENLSPADKDLLKWVGVFFRKPTPGKFMMRIRMPNGFAASEQLRAIADLSRRI